MAARIHFERGNTVIPSDNITGTGTVNRLAKFTAPNVIGDSLIFDNGTSVNNTGAGGEVTNTAFGTGALISNTTGLDNVAIGCRSLEDNTTGVNNAAVGYQALQKNTTQSQNTAMGFDALRDNEGNANSAFGRTALEFNTTGGNNTAVGVSSLKNNITGGNNTATGRNAGRFIADGSTDNETGSQNVFIGADSKANADGDTNEIVIGYNAIGNGTNSVVLGNDDIVSTELKGDVTISDYTEGALSTTNTGLIQLEPTFKNLSFGESYANLKTEDYLTNGFTVNPTDVGYQYAKLIQSDLLNKSSILLIPQATKESVLGVNRGADLDVVRATTATRVNSDGLIEEVAINVPRIDYTGGGCGKLLLEPQRTNLYTYSEQFDNAAWSKGNVTITANDAVSPDGLTNADKIVEDTTVSDRHATSQSITTASSTSYIAYIFAKKSERDFIYFRSNVASAFNLQWFDLTNKTVAGTVGSFDDAGVIEFANDWVLCYVKKTEITSASRVFQWALATDNLVETYTGDGTSGAYLWGAQLEAGSYPTSYIPTLAAAVTRNADEVSKTGISSLIGQTEGTIYLDFDFTNISETQVVFSIHDSANNKRLEIWANNSILYGFIGGSVNITIGSLSITNGRHKVALAYKQSGDHAFYIDGVQIGTSATAYTIAALTALRYDYWNTGFPPTAGVRQTLLFKTRLSNSELETLTTL